MKNLINRVLNLLLYLSLCFMVGTGLMLYLRLPARSRGGGGFSALGMDRHEWGDWHFYVALSFFTLCLVHLYMNWTWLVKIAASKHLWRLWVGLAVGAAIILFFLLIPVERWAD